MINFVQKLNKSIKIMIAFSFAFLILVLAIPQASPSVSAKVDAKAGCKNSSYKKECEKGYKGRVAKKSKSASCKGLSGSKKNACTMGFDRAKRHITASRSSSGDGEDSEMTQSGAVPVSDVDIDPLPDTSADDDSLDTVVNVAFGIAGSLALLFIVIGGVRYIMSQGDPSNLSRAKNTILYAVIGLVLTISAFGIVRFVLTRIV